MYVRNTYVHVRTYVLARIQTDRHTDKRIYTIKYKGSGEPSQKVIPVVDIHKCIHARTYMHMQLYYMV